MSDDCILPSPGCSRFACFRYQDGRHRGRGPGTFRGAGTESYNSGSWPRADGWSDQRRSREGAWSRSGYEPRPWPTQEQRWGKGQREGRQKGGQGPEARPRVKREGKGAAKGKGKGG